MPFSYKQELLEFTCIVNKKGMKNFSEGVLDSRNIAWFIRLFEILFPAVKKIIIDKKEEDIIEKVLTTMKDVNKKDLKMMVLLNQYHMEGIEHHWCNSFGLKPTFNVYHNADQVINPIGDMPLRKMLYERMYHVLQREIKSSRMRSSPASFTNDINVYHREFNHQYEHRNM